MQYKPVNDEDNATLIFFVNGSRVSDDTSACIGSDFD